MNSLSSSQPDRAPAARRLSALDGAYPLDSTPPELQLAELGLPSESHERWQRIQIALSDLRDGYEFASSLGREVWDFAVEIEGLQQRGLRANELRWLIFKGWVVHAHEVTQNSSERRRFTTGGPGASTPRVASCSHRPAPGCLSGCCRHPADRRPRPANRRSIG